MKWIGKACWEILLGLGLLFQSLPMQADPGEQEPLSLKGNRFLTFNTIIRVNQIEVTRDHNAGEDERSRHTPEQVISFRNAIEKGFPGSRITWAFSWLALHDTTENYRKIRELVVGYHKQYGDEVTFIPGAYLGKQRSA